MIKKISTLKDRLGWLKLVFFGGTILILCLIPVFYTREKLAIGGDIMIPFSSLAVKKYLYQWTPVDNGQYFLVNYYPIYLFYKIAELFGLNIYQISLTLLFSLSLVSALGILFLVRKVFSTNSFLLVVPVLFYLLSPALLNSWHYCFIYAFSPWFFYLIVKFIKDKKVSLLGLVCLNMVLFFASVDLPNPKYIFYLFWASLIIFITSFLLGLIDTKFFSDNLKKVPLFFGLSCYLFLPLVYFGLSYRADDYQVYVRGKNDGQEMIDYGVSTFDKVSKLHVGLVLNSEDKAKYGENPAVNILGYGFSLFILINLILVIIRLINRNQSEKENLKHELVFSFLTIAFFLFALGPNLPLGFIYKFFVTNFECLAFLRTTAGAVFFLSVFYSVLLFGFLNKFKLTKKLIAVFLVVNIFVVGYPLWKGDYYKNFNNANRFTDFESHGFVIPEVYFKAAELVNKQRLYSRAFYPKAALTYVNTNWGYFGPVLYNFLFDSYNIGYDKLLAGLNYHNIGLIINDNSLLTNGGVEIEDEGESIFNEDFIKIDRLSRKTFLPRVYTTDFLLSVKEKDDFVFPALFSVPGFDKRAVVFRESDKGGSNINWKSLKLEKKEASRFTLEDNLSFENGFWTEEPYDCAKGEQEPIFEMKISKDATEGNSSLELSASNNSACTWNTLKVNLQKNKNYQLSFDAKNLSGNQFGYYVNPVGRVRYPSSYQEITPGNSDWSHYNFLFEPLEDISRLELYFYSPFKREKTTNRFDNVKIEEVTFHLEDEQPTEPITPPILEYKKVNPATYRIKVHGAEGVFPLVLSEKFHKDWRIYQFMGKFKERLSQVDKKLTKYQTIANNEVDQASKDELSEFIEKGWITEISSPIKFVSKNFSGSIQNENLSSKGTWLRTKLIDTPHLKVNEYANAWLVNPEEICQHSKSCYLDEEGKYNFELLVEFWPQRLFVYSLTITLVTHFVCFAVLLKKSILKKKGIVKE